MAVLAVATVFAGEHWGWISPPPLAERFATLAGQEEQCGGVALSPRDAAAVNTAVVRIVHRADGCPASDLVEIFTKQSGTLPDQPDASFAISPKEKFQCIGPDSEDPCHVDVIGGKRVLLGAWQDPDTAERVPIVFYPDAEHERYEPATISLTPPVTAARATAASTPENLARIVVRDGRSQRRWPLAGSATTTAVVIAPGVNRGATLVAAYAAGGTPAALQLVARGFELGQAHGRVIITALCDGVGDDLRLTVRDADAIDTLLRRRWLRAVTARRISCRHV